MNVHGPYFPHEGRPRALPLLGEVGELFQCPTGGYRSAFDLEAPEFKILRHFRRGTNESHEVEDEKGFRVSLGAGLNIPEREHKGLYRFLGEVVPIETKIRAHIRLPILPPLIDHLAKITDDASDPQREAAGLFRNCGKNARPSRRNEHDRVVQVDLPDASRCQIIEREDDPAALQAGEFLSCEGIIDDEICECDFSWPCELHVLHCHL